MKLEVPTPDSEEAPDFDGATSSDEMRGESRRRHPDQELEMEEGLDPNSPLISGGSKSEREEEKAYEALLNHVGFGKFQILLLLVCGWANASGRMYVWLTCKYRSVDVLTYSKVDVCPCGF